MKKEFNFWENSCNATMKQEQELIAKLKSLDCTVAHIQNDLVVEDGED